MGRSRSRPSRAVAGIDPGSEWCGYAVLDVGDGLVDSGVWDVRRKKHEGGGMQMVRLGAHMDMLLRGLRSRFGEVFLVYEEIRFHGPDAGVDAAHGYGAVVGQVTAACEVHDVPYTGMAPATARKLATGRGDHGKEEVRGILEGEFGVRLDHGDRRIAIRKKKRKRGGPKTRVEPGYDESDAVALALAFAKEMGWWTEVVG